MTNVRRPIHLQLQRPTAMVSSSSGPGHFGSSSGSGAIGAGPGLNSPTAHHQQQAPPQSAPSNGGHSTPIRPNALINFNCVTQPPSISSPVSPTTMHQSIMSAAATATRPARPTTIHNIHNLMGPQHLHCQQAKALSPSGLNDSLPSQIMPHLFVGNQEQTNRETVNKMNIKYILSLGLLPMIMTSNGGTSFITSVSSPASPTPTKSSHNQRQQANKTATDQQQHKNLMPRQNSSRDFKIRIRSNTPTTPTTPTMTMTTTTLVTQASPSEATTTNCLNTNKSSSSSINTANIGGGAPTKQRDENKGVKPVRSIYCKCINIADNSDQLLSKFFDEAYTFIEEARRKKCNILIHCLAGISRSPTIAIAYLMRVRSLHWKDAYDLVKQCRPQIDPNLNFMGQLRIYNKSLRDEQHPPPPPNSLACKRASHSDHHHDGSILVEEHLHATIKSSKTVCCVDNTGGGQHNTT